MSSSPKIILETQRLLLRELTSDDAEFVYELNSDPEVIRHTGDSPFINVQEAHKFLTNYDQYRKYGIGRWGVIEKSSQKLIGWCGLKYSADVDEYDIGFRFVRDQWGRGYATESARACVDLGLHQRRFSMIVGRAMKVNTASIKVLTKIGLSYWKDDACGMADGVIYKIEKDPSLEEPDPC